MKHVEAVIRSLIDTGSRMAVKYVSPRQVIRATAIRQRGKVRTSRMSADIRLTIGKPNYKERSFIKSLTKASEPFPVRKIHLKSAKR